MNCLAQSANKPRLVSRNQIGEAIRVALDLYVGRGRRYSVKELSNGTGVPDRSIEAAKCEIDDPDYRPLTLENLLSICKFLGADFASSILQLSGLGAFDLMDEQQPLPQVLDACKSPAKLTKDEHIRKALEHLSAAEAME